MANNDQLAKNMSEILDVSINQAKKWIDAMDAEQLINATSAVDAEDLDSLQDVIDRVQTDAQEPDMTLSEIRKEINRLGKQNLEQNETHDDVWPLIARLSTSDWKMIWPSIHEDILISLLSEALDEEQDGVSGADADTIHAYAQDQLQEHMVYQGQIVEVVIPRGPHQTVGIRTPKGITMVHRHQLTQLHEHVLGMTAMPNLARMQALAGISTPEVTEAEHRIHVPGVGTITSDMMPTKIRRQWQDVQRKVSELDYLISAEPMDITQVDLVCKHLKHLTTQLCHNVSAAASEPK